MKGIRNKTGWLTDQCILRWTDLHIYFLREKKNYMTNPIARVYLERENRKLSGHGHNKKSPYFRIFLFQILVTSNSELHTTTHLTKKHLHLMGCLELCEVL